MVQAAKPKLDRGDVFPTVSCQIVGGSGLTLPQELTGAWQVLIFYRGHWWSHCRRQLADFQARLGVLDKKNIHVFAGSVDTQDNARETVNRLNLTFPVAWGLDPEMMADRLGVFYNKEGYLNSANFILRSDGTVAEALYSTGPIGRFNVAEVVGMIDFWTKDQ